MMQGNFCKFRKNSKDEILGKAISLYAGIQVYLPALGRTGTNSLVAQG